MLVESVEVFIVNNIPFSFRYVIAEKKKRVYYKDFAVNIPFFITKEQLKEVKELGNSTVILKHNHRYYWCPLYEAIYKSLLRKESKETLKRDLVITNRKGQITFKFSYKKKEYITHEVKELKLIS